jgi:hypothetical protein
MLCRDLAISRSPWMVSMAIDWEVFKKGLQGTHDWQGLTILRA